MATRLNGAMQDALIRHARCSAAPRSGSSAPTTRIATRPRSSAPASRARAPELGARRHERTWSARALRRTISSSTSAWAPRRHSESVHARPCHASRSISFRRPLARADLRATTWSMDRARARRSPTQVGSASSPTPSIVDYPSGRPLLTIARCARDERPTRRSRSPRTRPPTASWRDGDLPIVGRGSNSRPLASQVSRRLRSQPGHTPTTSRSSARTARGFASSRTGA